MQVIVNRQVDLSNYTPDELEFSYPRAAQLIIETKNDFSISIEGHNMLSDTYYTMPIIEQTSYDVISNITTAGLYSVDISSVDKVKIIHSETAGQIYIKILGQYKEIIE